MKYAKIIGTGSYLPEKVLTNFDLEKMVDTTDSWIVERTGIKERHIAAKEDTVTSMATIAAQNAMDAAGINKEDIDLIIVGTCTSDIVFPSTACRIQQQLGIPACNAFDVVAACASFVYGLNIADKFIRTGAAKCALIVGSEILSRYIDWEDRSTCVLFGDGAGAVVLRASEQPGIHYAHTCADGQYQNLLYVPSNFTEASLGLPFKVYMQGSEIFKVAVTKLGELVVDTLKHANFTQNDVDWLVPHQANFRIIQAVAKRLDLPMERVILTIDKHGNTSAASIPLALDHAVRSGKIKSGDKLLLETFGGGLAWGSAFLTY